MNDMMNAPISDPVMWVQSSREFPPIDGRPGFCMGALWSRVSAIGASGELYMNLGTERGCLFRKLAECGVFS